MSGEQPSLWGEPRAVARSSDPPTSWEAARSIRGKRIRESQAIVLRLLRAYGPMTDEQLLEYLARSEWAGTLSPSGARTRRSELVSRGLVFDTRRRWRLASGRLAIVWQAVGE